MTRAPAEVDQRNLSASRAGGLRAQPEKSRLEHTIVDPQSPPKASARGGHGWMMIACCIPMLIVAGALVATGVVSGVFLVYAVACTAMMAMMMRGMRGQGSDPGSN